MLKWHEKIWDLGMVYGIFIYVSEVANAHKGHFGSQKLHSGFYNLDILKQQSFSLPGILEALGNKSLWWSVQLDELPLDGGADYSNEQRIMHNASAIQQWLA